MKSIGDPADPVELADITDIDQKCFTLILHSCGIFRSNARNHCLRLFDHVYGVSRYRHLDISLVMNDASI